MLAFQFFHRNIADGVARMYETAISTPSKYTLDFVCIDRYTHTYIHPHTPREAEIHSCGWRYDGNIFIIFLCSHSVVLICLSHFDTRISGSVVPWKSVAFIRIEQCAIRPTILFNTIQSMPSHPVLKSSEYDGVLEPQPTKINVKHKFYQHHHQITMLWHNKSIQLRIQN